MEELSFEVAKAEHARAINMMREASSVDLTERLGPGPWTGTSRLQSIRERISLGDPDELRRKTIYVASREGQPIASVSVATFFPTFWKPRYWEDPKAPALGVFDLVVFPELQRKGIGQFLMAELERLAKDHGFAYVRLDAFAKNPFSVGFYRKIGYRECGKIEVRTCPLILFEKRVLL